MDTIICQKCRKEIDPKSIVCNYCNYPVSEYATMDPFKSAIVEASVIGSAIKRPKKLIVVIGTWMLLGAFALLYISFVLTDIKSESFDPVTIIFALIGIFFLILAILSTRNYLRFKREDRNRKE